MTSEQKKRIEAHWKARLLAIYRWQPGKALGKKAEEAQAEFFAGAMAALEAVLGDAPSAHWALCAMTGRPIVTE